MPNMPHRVQPVTMKHKGHTFPFSERDARYLMATQESVSENVWKYGGIDI